MKQFSFFCIIGGQRCGTTWLAQHLNNHPSIQMAMPMIPEPKYFLEEKVPNKKEYIERYFDLNHEIPTCIGEKTTSYLENPKVATRVIQCFPQAQIIILLRDPVERAISNYKFSLDNGLETRSLREVFIEEKDEPELEGEYSVYPFDYFERGLYAKKLIPYLNIFENKNIGIWLYEEVVGNKEGLKKILQFLNLDLAKGYNKSKGKINKSFQISDEALELVRTTLRKQYAPFNRELKELIGVDLSVWDYN